MRLLELDQMQLHWREDGDPDGAPIVFANSLGTDLRLWDSLLPYLPTDRRIVRFDLRGHGLTSCPPPPYSLDDLTGDISDLLDSLNVRACMFVGTSIGGMIGQNLAVNRRDLVRNLVLTNTAPRMGDPTMWAARVKAVRDSGLEGIADDIMQRWFGPAFLPHPKVALWRKRLTQVDPDGYIGCCCAIADADLMTGASDISQRTLIIGGAQDRACPPEMAQNMQALIPNSECHILPDVGHLPSVEAPQALAVHINRFLNEVSDV